MSAVKVLYDGQKTLLLAHKVFAVEDGTLVAYKSAKQFSGATVLLEYPPKRWTERVLHMAESGAIVAPQSVKRELRTLAENLPDYSLDNFKKELIMATAKKTTEEKAAPAAKKATAAPAKTPAAKPAAKAAPAAKPAAKTAAPAKAPAKAAKPEGDAPARRGRAPNMDIEAKIKKGSADFKAATREGTVRHGLMAAIVGGVGKPVKEVLGVAVGNAGHTVKPVDVRFAIENGYIAV